VEPVFANLFPALAWFMVLSGLAYFFPLFHPKKKYNALFLGLFTLKTVVGILVWWIYTYYYTDRSTSDIYRFFNDARVAYDLLGTRPDLYLKLITGIDGHSPELLTIYDIMNNWYKSFDDGFINENRTLIRMNALLMPLTNGSYFGNLVIVCFAGTLAQAYLFKAVTAAFAVNHLFLFALLNLWPSELFWSSALMKEPMLMIGLALAIGSVVYLKKEKKITPMLIFLPGVFLILYSKFYVGVALIMPLMALFITKATAGVRKSMSISLFLFLLLPFLVLLWGKLAPQRDIPKLIAAKKNAFANVAESTNAGSAFHIPALNPDLCSLTALAPTGITNALFRPFPQDADSLMEWAAVAENTLFLCLIAFLTFRISRNAPWRSFSFNLILFGIIVLVLGGITVNISGALVRYKMPVIPYLALAFYVLTLKGKTEEGEAKIR
jgi:hypothetical protein